MKFKISNDSQKQIDVKLNLKNNPINLEVLNFEKAKGISSTFTINAQIKKNNTEKSEAIKKALEKDRASNKEHFDAILETAIKKDREDQQNKYSEDKNLEIYSEMIRVIAEEEAYANCKDRMVYWCNKRFDGKYKAALGEVGQWLIF